MKNSNKNGIVMRWLARIGCIAFAAFLSVFAVDVFAENKGLWETLKELFIHLIPAFVIILVLILSWKKEFIGGSIYILLGILYLTVTWGKFHWSVYLLISGGLFVLGILFFISWNKNRKLHSS